MLATLALVVTQGGAPLSELTELPLAQTLLKDCGYEFRPTWRGPEADATLAQGGRRVRVRVPEAWMYVPPKGRAVLQLSAELDVPRELPQADLRGLIGTLPPGRVVFAPSLGRTVTAHGDVALDARSTPEGTRAAIGRYFAAVDAYARSHGARWAFHSAKDWGRGSLGDDLVLNRPDPESLRRLLRSWGFETGSTHFRGAYGTSVLMSDHSVSVLPGRGAANEGKAVTIGAGIIRMEDARARAWRRAARGAKRSVGFEGDDRGRMEERIPLPIRAGELKRRLFAIGRDVGALELDPLP